ncbi:MAG: transcriptional regulator [Rhodoferax sp.]|nr:transcriptional regulator [Rhodoferax sp.]
MYTVKETALFQRKAASVLSASELDELIDWISVNPLAGDVIPGAAPLRKVRWARAGMGKRGGSRVIYFNKLENGLIVLLTVYSKSVDDNLSAAFLRKLLELEEF